MSDIGDVFDQGEALILATDAREARVSMHEAAHTHSTRIFQQICGLGIAGLGFFLGDPHYEVVAVGLVFSLGVEFFRRRARRELNHARQRASELEAAYRTAADRERHHTS